MNASDVAIVAAVVFVWGTLSARLERYDVTAPIIFVLAGLLLTHGPLAPLGFAPSRELVKALAEITLVLAFESLTWQMVVYAVLSLTVIRMVPVALALPGSRAAVRPLPSWAGSAPVAWRRWYLRCWRWRM